MSQAGQTPQQAQYLMIPAQFSRPQRPKFLGSFYEQGFVENSTAFEKAGNEH